jgi:glycosyltransferase involved in cell wall biosynthesis
VGKSWKPGGVSAVLIVKNEEAVLRRCLESLKGADEIVVLDTGSSDGTLQIAREHTAKVVQTAPIVPFHFAEARNRADKLATKDWILTIDADEVLVSGGMEEIQEALRAVRSMSKAVHSFRVNFEFPEEGKEEIPFIKKMKLYRRGSYEWKYRVHEQLVPVDPGQVTLDLLSVRIQHRPITDKTGRRVQNTELLELAVSESPEYRRNMRQLGMEYFMAEDWAAASEWLTRYLLVPADGDAADLSECMSNLAKAKDKLGLKEEALAQFDKAIMVAPGRREPRYFKAVSLIAACRLDEAIDCLEACLEIKREEAPSYYLNVEAIWSGELPNEALKFCEEQIKEAKARVKA